MVAIEYKVLKNKKKSLLPHVISGSNPVAVVAVGSYATLWPMKLKFNDKQLVDLEIDLGRLYKKALPHAEVEATNRMASDLKNNWQSQMRSTFTLRNRFTERSVRIERARVANPVATVGSISPYLDKQEFGATEQSKGRHGVPVPTEEARIGRDPKRLVRSANKLRNIRLPKRKHRATGGRGARNRAAIEAAAAQTGRNRYAFLDLGSKKGLFRVTGRSTKRRGTFNLRVRMIVNLSDKQLRIPKHPTLGPAIARTIPRGPEMYRRALLNQIARQRLFQAR